jgi:hypothetical protein
VSFSFNAAGSKRQVVAQLREIAEHKRNIGTGELGPQLAGVLAEHINQDESEPGGWEYVYVVTAGGHSGGSSPSSLNCSVTAHYVMPALPAGDPDDPQ